MFINTSQAKMPSATQGIKGTVNMGKAAEFVIANESQTERASTEEVLVGIPAAVAAATAAAARAHHESTDLTSPPFPEASHVVPAVSIVEGGFQETVNLGPAVELVPPETAEETGLLTAEETLQSTWSKCNNASATREHNLSNASATREHNLSNTSATSNPCTCLSVSSVVAGGTKRRKKGGSRLSRSMTPPQCEEGMTGALITGIEEGGEAARQKGRVTSTGGASEEVAQDITEVLRVAEVATAQAEESCIASDVIVEEKAAEQHAAVLVVLDDAQQAATAALEDILVVQDAEIPFMGLSKPIALSQQTIATSNETPKPAQKLSRKRSSSLSNLGADSAKPKHKLVSTPPRPKKGSWKEVKLGDLLEAINSTSVMTAGVNVNLTKRPLRTTTKQLLGGEREMNTLHTAAAPPPPALGLQLPAAAPPLPALSLQLPAEVSSSHHEAAGPSPPPLISSLSEMVDLACSPIDMSRAAAVLDCSVELPSRPAVSGEVEIIAVDATPLAAATAAAATAAAATAGDGDETICSLTHELTAAECGPAIVTSSKRKLSVLPMFLPMAERKRIQQEVH
jgi:hypothetical protein